MKEILKDNLWNQIFHSKQLRQQRSTYWRMKALILNSPKMLQFIKEADTLNQLLSCHKRAWIYGFRNQNLGPSEFGMFRTKNILNMTQDEVYLGGIYGLWTFTIREWNERADEGEYNVILHQYRKLLLSNVEEITSNAKQYVEKYEMQNLRRRSY